MSCAVGQRIWAGVAERTASAGGVPWRVRPGWLRSPVAAEPSRPRLREDGVLPPCVRPVSVQHWAQRPELPRDLTVSSSLDLDAWINEPPSDSESEDEKPKAIFHEEEQRHAKQRQPEADEEELARVSPGCTEAGRLPIGASGTNGLAQSPRVLCAVPADQASGCVSPGSTELHFGVWVGFCQKHGATALCLRAAGL